MKIALLVVMPRSWGNEIDIPPTVAKTNDRFCIVKGGRADMTPNEIMEKVWTCAFEGDTENAHRLLDDAIRAFLPVRLGIERLERERMEEMGKKDD